MSAAQSDTRIVEEGVVYPAIPVTKDAFVALIYIADLRNRDYFVTFGPRSKIAPEALKLIKHASFYIDRRGGRSIITPLSMGSEEPFDPLAFKLGEVDLTPLETHVNRVAALHGGKDPLTVFTLRGLLLNILLLNASRITSEILSISIDYPLVARVAGRYAAAPIALGLLTEVRLVEARVPVLVGEPVIPLTPRRLEALAIHTADYIPGLMRTAAKIVRLVIDALEADEIRAALSDLKGEKALKVMGVALEKAAEVTAPRPSRGEAGGAGGEAGGESRETGDDVKKVVESLSAAMEELGLKA